MAPLKPLKRLSNIVSRGLSGASINCPVKIPSRTTEAGIFGAIIRFYAIQIKLCTYFKYIFLGQLIYLFQVYFLRLYTIFSHTICEIEVSFFNEFENTRNNNELFIHVMSVSVCVYIYIDGNI